MLRKSGELRGFEEQRNAMDSPRYVTKGKVQKRKAMANIKLGDVVKHKLTMQDGDKVKAKECKVIYINEARRWYMVAFNLHGKTVRECYHY